MSSIITFYSYKGGVGRTMAMANVAVILARKGLRVLAVDWDLEAPGLERYFGYFTMEPGKGGLLPLLQEYRKGSRGHYRPHLSRVSGTLGASRFELDLLPSGRESDERYAATLGRFDWEKFYAQGGGDFIESLREQWIRQYDVTLIDSRTGLSDTSGICTIQLPDTVVAMFTANHQSLFGVRDIMRLAQEARGQLAYDRPHLRVLPVPARFARDGSTPEAVDWIGRIADTLSEFYSDWIPSWATAHDVAQVLRIPQVDAYGFGEKLAVVEEDSADSGGLTLPCRQLADLVTQDQPDVVGTLGIARKTPKPVKATAPAGTDYRHDVYVSHAAGSVLDDWLVAFLEALRQESRVVIGRPLDAFLDLSELRAGMTWRAEAEDALLRSRLMLAVVTPEFVASEACRREWATFEQRETSGLALILPLLVRRPRVLPEWVERRRWFDLTELPRGAAAYSPADMNEATHRRLTDIAKQIDAMLTSVPAFDGRWTIAESVGRAAPEPERTAPDAGSPELALGADAMAALLKTDDRPDVIEAGLRLVDQLRRARDFASVIKVAEPLLARMPHHIKTLRYYAIALIHAGRPADAVKALRNVERHIAKSDPEFSEVSGLLGLAYRSMWIASSDRTSRSASAALSNAINAYRNGYATDQRRNVWHGINVVALRAAARRLGHSTRGEEKRLARSILGTLLNQPQSLSSEDPWYHSWLAELYLAVEDWDQFATHVRAYMASPQVDAFELGSFLRQLTEVWQIDGPHAARAWPLVAELRAQLLSMPGGSISVTPSAARSTAVDDRPALEKVFTSAGPASLQWMQTGLVRARSVGALREKGGGIYGSCFVLDGGDVGAPGAGPLIITASHVVGRYGAISSPRAEASFQAADPPVVVGLGQEVWTSPPDEYDVAIFSPRHAPVAVLPLPVANQLPTLDAPQRVYLIGHSGGGELKLSLEDNELLDHEGPPSGSPSPGGAVKLHYRAPTDAGSSGAPVFNDRWEVIGLHHAGGAALQRLNGKPGTYEANEGVSIASVAAAVQKNATASPRLKAGRTTAARSSAS